MRRQTMKTHSFIRVKHLAVISVILLLAVSVLAGTVYAVTLDSDGILPVSADANEQVGESSPYTITVKTNYAESVNDNDHRQTVEIYNNTSAAAVASGTGTVVSYSMTAENTSPTFNVKSNNKVSVTAVTVKSGDDDITATAFGGEGAYKYFLESTKTSPFGYFELYDITDNITVEVTYGEPLSDLGKNGSSPMYSITVVTKGDTGAYHTLAASDQK